MFSLSPLSILGQVAAGKVVGTLASAAADVAQAATDSGIIGKFSELISDKDMHGNGWLTRADTLGRGLIAGGEFLTELAREDPADTAAKPQTRIAQAGTDEIATSIGSAAAQMRLAAEDSAPDWHRGGVSASPMLADLRATYAELRAQR